MFNVIETTLEGGKFVEHTVCSTQHINQAMQHAHRIAHCAGLRLVHAHEHIMGGFYRSKDGTTTLEVK